ncbi:hypothetical protein H9Q72_006407 [Fusarium xylarioides]|uniref:Amidohydrolase-related domain-containing protein n=1 Tax=Fusarium xylarioides TaxID=221167 RepID=A0A9P7L5R7_9HYPO|nr:hypothetical protein H9Q72_006407 [Fusarium xylarioides]
MSDAKTGPDRFYFDIALSTSAVQLHGLLDTVDADRILFGSDYPYAPAFAIDALLQQKTPREFLVSLLKKHALMEILK